MKKTGIIFLAALLLMTMLLFGCGKEKEINYDHFIQTIASSNSGVAAAIDGEVRGQNYVLVFVNVQNDTKDPVTVRKGDYALHAGGETYVCDGYLARIELQSGGAGSERLTTLAFDTIGKGDGKKLGVLFFCDANVSGDFTVTFHDREVQR